MLVDPGGQAGEGYVDGPIAGAAGGQDLLDLVERDQGDRDRRREDVEQQDDLADERYVDADLKRRDAYGRENVSEVEGEIHRHRGRDVQIVDPDHLDRGVHQLDRAAAHRG